MPTLFSDADVGIGSAPKTSGLMSDADVGITGAPPPVSPSGGLPEVNIPGIGKPSMIGMMKGLIEGVRSGATLPRDVYQGKVDPLSEEGIKRSTDLAMMAQVPSAGRTLANRAAEAAPTSIELKTAATPGYQEATKLGNTIPVEGSGIAKGIIDELHPQALRPGSAPRTYSELNNLSKASDLNDVAIARDNMRDIANGISENKLIRVAGEDSTAARKAMNHLDSKMDELSPGWTEKMKLNDANWAAARRMDTVTKEAEKGQRGRLGSFDTNETRAKGFTPDELAAIKKAHQGGNIGTLMSGIGAGFNPFHGGLAPALSIPAHVTHGIMTGGMSNLIGIPAGMMADLAAKGLRQRALNAAIEKIASRSPLGQERAATGGILQMPQLNLPQPSKAFLPYANRQQQ